MLNPSANEIVAAWSRLESLMINAPGVEPRNKQSGYQKRAVSYLKNPE